MISPHTVALFKELNELFEPPTVLSTEKWSEENRVLGRETSSLFGKFSLDPTPYMREPYSAFEKDPNLRKIVLQFGAQLSKSEFLLNSIGAMVDQDPGPALLVLPTLGLAESFSKVRLKSLFNDTPILRGRVSDERARNGRNSTMFKAFDGGSLEIVSCTESALSSKPIRYLFFDELSAAETTGTMGADPLEMAEKRTATFAYNKRIILTSTPRRIGCRISTEYANSTRELYYVPCPLCGFYQVLDFFKLSDSPEPEHECINCKRTATQVKYRSHFAEGEWRGERTHDDDGYRLTTRGFKLNSLYSHVFTWRELKQEYKEAKQLQKDYLDQSKLRVFVNTVLAEPFNDELGEKVDENKLFVRREDYGAELPDGVRILTAGADVQDNRIECVVMGWGLNLEAWVIDRIILPGQTDQPQVWQELTDQVYNRFWSYADGARKRIDFLFCDSGFRTEFVRAWIKGKQSRAAMSKGWSGPDKGVLTAPMTWKYGVPHRFIGTHSAKADILGTFLNVDTPGAGYWHFPKHLQEDFFSGLTSEVSVSVKRKGHWQIEWHLVTDKARNEVLDCAVLNYAALLHLGQHSGAHAKLERTEKPSPGVAPVEHKPRHETNVEPETAKVIYTPSPSPAPQPAAQQQQKVYRWMKRNKQPSTLIR